MGYVRTALCASDKLGPHIGALTTIVITGYVGFLGNMSIGEKRDTNGKAQ
jgi:hypothetical protein